MVQVQYDRAIIDEFAHRLYHLAGSAVWVNTLLGVLIGGGIGAAIGKVMASDVYMIASLVIGTGVGWWQGRERAFQLKLQAQSALCQARIEENTRRAAGGGS